MRYVWCRCDSHCTWGCPLITELLTAAARVHSNLIISTRCNCRIAFPLFHYYIVNTILYISTITLGAYSLRILTVEHASKLALIRSSLNRNEFDRERSVCGLCPVPGDHPSQAAWRWSVLRWVTAGPWAAYQNTEREVIFQRL